METKIGDRFGKLTIIAPADPIGWHKRWHCRCDCGQETVTWQLSLRKRGAVSCGCHRRETTKERWRKFQENGVGFWAKVDRSGGPEACWPWLGSRSDHGHGYGLTSYKGKGWRAHRLAWFLSKGSIEPNATHRHICDNKRCCNPAHQIPGTQLENVADIVARGLLKKGQNKGHRNGRAKLNYDAAECIRRAATMEKLSQNEIAFIFGVSQNAVSQIITGKRYA